MHALYLLTSIVSFCIGINGEIIQATFSNSSFEYFVISDSPKANFSDDTIICSDSSNNCHIKCDVNNGCQNTIIYASNVDSLTLECLADYSCDSLQLQSSPTSSLSLFCPALSSCRFSTIDASNASTSLTIGCINKEACYSSTFDYSTTIDILNINCIGKDSCYGLALSRSSTNNLFGNMVDITCVNTTACKNTNFDIRYFNDVNIVCNISYACNTATFMAQHTSNMANVYCESFCGNINIDVSWSNEAVITLDYNGQYADIYGNNMYGSNGLTVNCPDYWSCLKANIWCPIDTKCNIICPAGRSCQEIIIHVPDKNYHNLMLECNTLDAWSCKDGYFKCNDNNDQSDLVRRANGTTGSITYKWGCSTQECCPLNPLYTIDCAKLYGIGVDCIIDCETTVFGTCEGYKIDGSLANSLTLNCVADSGWGVCEGSQIICPTNDDKDCNILCQQSHGCKWAVVELAANNTGNVRITCNDSYACNQMELYATNQIETISSLNWDCIGDLYSCTATITNLALINNIHIVNYQCIYSNACDGVSLIGTAVINELILYAPSRECIVNSNIDVYVTKLVNVTCKEDNACGNSNMIFRDLDNGNVIFDCIGDVSGFIQGSCYNSYFEVTSAVMTPHTTNISVSCFHNDCKLTTFNFTDYMNIVTMNCGDGIDTDYYSCEEAEIMASNSNQLNLNCVSSIGCSMSTVYCPYSTQNSCNIKCGKFYRSCYNMNIIVSDDYNYGYLDIECSTIDEFNDQTCKSVNFTCIDTQNTVTYVLNDTDANNVFYECDNEETIDCCPWRMNVAPTTTQIVTTTTQYGTTGSASTTMTDTATTSAYSTTSISDTVGSTAISVTDEPTTTKKSEISTTIVAETTEHDSTQQTVATIANSAVYLSKYCAIVITVIFLFVI